MKSSEWRYVFTLDQETTTFLRSRIPVKPNASQHFELLDREM